MPKRKATSFTSDPEIRRLERLLERARDGVWHALPPAGQDFRYELKTIHTQQALMEWIDRLISTVIQAARERAGKPVDAAPCPLCGSVTTSLNATPWVLPTGLTRHLLGREGARPCPITRAILDDVYDRALPLAEA